jgi:hypothetical protein
MNKRIETYLQKTTRGLWGNKRREVKEELSTHIEGRVNAHLIAGLNETDAVEKALSELGQPKIVSTGMARLYTFPVVAGSSLLLAILIMFSIILLPNTNAQLLETSSVFPSQQCLQDAQSNNCEPREIWLSLEELVTTLTSQGVEVIQEKHSVKLLFPGSKTPINVDGRSSLTFYESEAEDQIAKPELQPVLGYITFWEFINEFLATPYAPEVKITGWEDITLSIGSAKIQLQLDETLSERLYMDYLIQTQNDLFNYSSLESTSTWSTRDTTSTGYHFTLRSPAQGIYGIIKLERVQDHHYDFTISVSPATEQGNLIFYGAIGNPRFIDSFHLDPIPEKQTALLLRLTGVIKDGKVGYEIISPDQITLE